MSLNLQQIRDYVRGHLDIDTEDLPDVVLDIFIQEGSNRIDRAEKRWPFRAARWTYSTVAATDEVPFTSIGTGVREIKAIKGPRWNLTWVGTDLADWAWPENTTQSSEPTHFYVEDGTLYLFPVPDGAYTLQVRGYATQTDWIAAGAGAEPDFPSELHNTVALWALAKAYAQQDDPEMAQLYERQFADELNLYRRMLNDTPAPQPLVLNGGFGVQRPGGRLRYDWEF